MMSAAQVPDRSVRSATNEAQAFVREQLGFECAVLEPVGEGAWSRCFGFHNGDEELVIRFGHHPEDFEKDRWAAKHRTPSLPIPRVHSIGRAFDGYYAISTRVHGAVLEQLPTGHWRNVVPSLASALEAMRSANVSATKGYGGWGGNGNASHPTWSSYLLSVGDDGPDRRTHGWRTKLASCPEGEETFAWGTDRLRKVAVDDVPRSLIHGDLINRNVLVGEFAITGVLDWGCSCYGDHLYDMAWFDFWAPWHSNLDIDSLWSEVKQRWREASYTPRDLAARLEACYLHIGLDHLAYNAWLEDWSTLSATAQRMRALVTGG